MDKSYADLLKENDLLKGTIQKLQETIDRLESEVKRINNELHKYKNENTPPSANKHLKGSTRGFMQKVAKEARHSDIKALQGIKNLTKSKMWTQTSALTATAMISKMWTC